MKKIQIALTAIALIMLGGYVARGQYESCHGRNLRGEAPGAPRVQEGSLVPSLAGRSPTYIARQLFDLSVGVRRGAMSGFMRPVLGDLNPVDMLSIAAYVATLAPPPLPSPSTMQTASR